jgi:phosphopantothenoylcysteine decarboxylase/phosphopantothenate--cysteine ligase
VKTKNLKQFDIIIVCAALADYLPKKQKGKIPSGKQKLQLELLPAPKVLPYIRKKASKATIIAFKVEKNKEQVIPRSLALLKKHNLDFAIGNSISSFGADETTIWLINKQGKSIKKRGDKEYLADQIFNTILKTG